MRIKWQLEICTANIKIRISALQCAFLFTPLASLFNTHPYKFYCTDFSVNRNTTEKNESRVEISFRRCIYAPTYASLLSSEATLHEISPDSKLWPCFCVSLGFAMRKTFDVRGFCAEAIKCKPWRVWVTGYKTHTPPTHFVSRGSGNHAWKWNDWWACYSPFFA